jgi:hypothetical protein
MKKVNLFIIGYLLLMHFVLAQNMPIEALTKIEETYYVEANGQRYFVNSSVVTVKLKSGVEQSNQNN